jgi:hypothetical protein
MGSLASRIVEGINQTTNDYDAVEEADKIIKLYLDEGKTLLEIDKMLAKKWKEIHKNDNR